MADNFSQPQFTFQATQLVIGAINYVGFVDDGFIEIIKGKKAANAKGYDGYQEPDDDKSNGLRKGIIALKAQTAGQ